VTRGSRFGSPATAAFRIEPAPAPPHTAVVSSERLSIPRYAMALAHVASLRSEDPYRKVGAAALDFDNRVIGTAYNGLAPGFDPPPGFWDDREARQKFMLHAEVNLCSLFRRGEANLVATTTMPCTACMQTLCAYGIREIYYRDVYQASDAPQIAALYGVKLEQVTDVILTSP
jgi:dCMP deaminase